jgi:regulator of replication initiation timing
MSEHSYSNKACPACGDLDGCHDFGDGNKPIKAQSIDEHTGSPVGDQCPACHGCGRMMGGACPCCGGSGKWVKSKDNPDPDKAVMEAKDADDDLRKAVESDFQQWMVQSMTPDRGYLTPIDNVRKLLQAKDAEIERLKQQVGNQHQLLRSVFYAAEFAKNDNGYRLQKLMNATDNGKEVLRELDERDQLRAENEALRKQVADAIAEWKAFYEAELDECDKNVARYESEKDFYGVNYQQGKRSGFASCDIGLTKFLDLQKEGRTNGG